jgi:DNA-binding response OmpR family regulator
MTVLLAEDDAVLGPSLARTLGTYFGEVLATDNGDRALALFQNRPAHMAVLDISMPGMSGMDVAVAIRKQDPDLPVIILTCHDDVAFMQQAVRLRLMAYLIKPLDLAVLEDILSRCLEEMRQRNRLDVCLAEGVVFNPAIGTAFRQGNYVPLTHNEQRFLSILTANRGTAVAPERLCLALGRDCRTEFSMNALRNLVYRLRGKIGPDAVVCNKDSGYMLP